MNLKRSLLPPWLGKLIMYAAAVIAALLIILFVLFGSDASAGDSEFAVDMSGGRKVASTTTMHTNQADDGFGAEIEM